MRQQGSDYTDARGNKSMRRDYCRSSPIPIQYTTKRDERRCKRIARYVWRAKLHGRRFAVIERRPSAREGCSRHQMGAFLQGISMRYLTRIKDQVRYDNPFVTIVVMLWYQ
jgi:hypothetical protein